MKKLLFLFLGFIAILMGVSCNSNEEQVTAPSSDNDCMTLSQEDLQGLKDLSFQIQCYNEQFSSTNTRAKKIRLPKWLAVIAADGIGLLSGGPGTSALFSGTAVAAILAKVDKVIYDVFFYNTNTIHTRTLDSTLTEKAVVVINSSNYTTAYSDSIGYYHNVLIREILSDSTKAHSFSTLTGNKLVAFVNNLSDSIGIFPILEIGNKPLMDSVYQQAEDIVKIVDGAETKAELYLQLRNTGMLSSSEMNVIESYLDGLYNLNLSENDGSYTRGVLHVVDSSNVSSTIKEKLGNIMIVSNASSYLWVNSNVPNLTEN